MNVGMVVGSVVASCKHQALTGVKLLLVRDIVAGKPAGLCVAADCIGVGEADGLVYMVGSSEAAAAFRRGLMPVDRAIVGIVDQYNSTRYTL